MKEIKSNAATLLWNGRTHSIAKLIGEASDMKSINFSKTEMSCIVARLNGLSLSQLSPQERKSAIRNIFIEGVNIFGYQTPITMTQAESQEATLERYILRHGFGEYTEEELILGLELNTQIAAPKSESSIDVTNPFGYFFNPAFFARAMQIYSNIRHTIDRKFQNYLSDLSLHENSQNN